MLLKVSSLSADYEKKAKQETDQVRVSLHDSHPRERERETKSTKTVEGSGEMAPLDGREVRDEEEGEDEGEGLGLKAGGRASTRGFLSIRKHGWNESDQLWV